MAEGPELSPFILKALLYSGADQKSRAPAMAYLAAKKPVDTLIYPVYTSAGMLMNRLDRGELWRRHLLSFQAEERLGWTPKDLGYGGWSYALAPPRKTASGQLPTLSQSNLPSTLFALGGLALSEGGLPPESALQALIFVQRCQNFDEGDGGFCASPTDESMNKAGGHLSYGSATSDGLRGLLRCGLPLTHPRVVAARAWTEKHLSPKVHPGAFPEGRYYDRDSLYFYYCWSTVHALAALQRGGATLSQEEVAWQAAVQAELLGLQKPDGSWSNPAAATREDDPLVATPLVMAVLVLTDGTAEVRAPATP